MKQIRINEYSRRKVYTGIMLVAFVGAIATFLILLNIAKNELNNYEKREVYCLEGQLEKGEKITTEVIGSRFVLREIEASMVPTGAITDPTLLEGHYARVDLAAGQILTVNLFRQEDERLDGDVEMVVAGIKADDLYQAVGGVLRSGDQVNILMIGEEGEVCAVWDSVSIQQVFESSGTQIGGTDNTTAASRINVFLPKDRVTEFYSQLACCEMRMVLIYE